MNREECKWNVNREHIPLFTVLFSLLTVRCSLITGFITSASLQHRRNRFGARLTPTFIPSNVTSIWPLITCALLHWSSVESTSSVFFIPLHRRRGEISYWILHSSFRICKPCRLHWFSASPRGSRVMDLPYLLLCVSCYFFSFTKSTKFTRKARKNDTTHG